MSSVLKEKAMSSAINMEREDKSTGRYKPITWDDIILAAVALTVIVVGISATIAIAGVQSATPESYQVFSIVGAIGVTAMSFIAMFKKNIGPVFSVILSILQGFMLGGIMVVVYFMEFTTDVEPVELIFQALIGVVGATIACAAAYHFEIIRVGSKFRKITFILALGFSITYLINLVLILTMGSGLNLWGGGVLNIVVSAIAIIAASMSLIVNFDNCNNLVVNGAPKSARWGLGAATGVVNSIVWLFTEILRLLVNINRS